MLHPKGSCCERFNLNANALTRSQMRGQVFWLTDRLGMAPADRSIRAFLREATADKIRRAPDRTVAGASGGFAVFAAAYARAGRPYPCGQCDNIHA
jgi:hypothetical protein